MLWWRELLPVDTVESIGKSNSAFRTDGTMAVILRHKSGANKSAIPIKNLGEYQ